MSTPFQPAVVLIAHFLLVTVQLTLNCFFDASLTLHGAMLLLLDMHWLFTEQAFLAGTQTCMHVSKTFGQHEKVTRRVRASVVECVVMRTYLGHLPMRGFASVCDVFVVQ